MITFFGDCEKHDFVLAVAISLSVVNKKNVTVVTDNFRNYKYFEGEVSGIRISSSPDAESINIYDFHKVIPETENELVLCTDFSRDSIDKTIKINSQLNLDDLVVIEEDSNVSLKYIKTFIGEDSNLYVYPYSSKRKLNVCFEGKLNFKTLDSEFLKTVGKFLIEKAGVDKNNINPLWNYLRKRG